MLALIKALRSIASNREVLWLVQQGILALSKIEDGEDKRRIASTFAREAAMRAKVLGFDEAMKRIGTR